MSLKNELENFPCIKEVFVKYGGSSSKIGHFSVYDWFRISTAYHLTDFGDILEVGPGNGQLLSIYVASGRVKSLHAIDIITYSVELPREVSFSICSVDNMKQFSDNQFDTVVCMEVLEHLPITIFSTALKELRRVCRNRLIVALPFNEQAPLFLEGKLGGHQQSFNFNKLNHHFNGIACFIENYSTDWILIVDDLNNNNGLDIISRDRLIKEHARIKL